MYSLAISYDSSMTYQYELIIIGAGSGGLTAADVATELGLSRVALIESREKLGGECLHSGCVPSKALIHAAQKFGQDEFKTADDVWSHVRRSIKRIEDHHDNDEHYQSRGIKTFHGKAYFSDDHSVVLEGGESLTSKYFLVATGSSPYVPEINGLGTVDYRTNETVFEMSTLPESLTIIGGGNIGCELAYAFSKLGTNVTILQSGPRILPRDDDAASEAVHKNLVAMGATIVCDASITSASQEHDRKTISYTQGGKSLSVSAQELLIATGRTPNVNLSLEKASVSFDKRGGIAVNTYLQTSQSHIYAVGDCTTSPKFTHLAGSQAATAVRNMLLPLFKSKSAESGAVPRVTFTHPEIGQIGYTQSELNERKLKYEVLTLDSVDIDRAVTHSDTDGFIKVCLDSKGFILGATIVMDNASEIVGVLSTMYYNRLPFQAITKSVIAYPTYANGLQTMALRYVSTSSRSHPLWGYISKHWK